MQNKYNYWPGYIPPEKDELLSSWIYRVANEHKIKPYSFTRYYFNNPSFWTRDVDKFITTNVLNTILKYTPLNELQIKQMLLSSFDNVIYQGRLSVSYTNGLTNLGIFSAKRKGYGLLLCSKCLIKNPYYKKEWRLLTSLICLTCKSYLIDNCPKCNNPIIFHRLSMDDKNNYFENPLYLCWNCKYDFREIDKPLIDDSLIFEYQSYINSSITLGYNSHTQYSFLYFEAFFHIYKRVQTNSIIWNRFREGLKKEYKIEHVELYTRTPYHSSLEFRTLVMPLIYHLLSDWPDRFIIFCKNYNIRYSDLSKAKKTIPFWLENVFKNYF